MRQYDVKVIERKSLVIFLKQKLFRNTCYYKFHCAIDSKVKFKSIHVHNKGLQFALAYDSVNVQICVLCYCKCQVI